MDFAIDHILIPLIKIVLIMAIVPGYVAIITLAERKVIAWMQVRLGPMRVGPWGILQMVADPLKLLIKEDIVPERADRWIFTLAPVICLIPAFIVLAVIPIGPPITSWEERSPCTSRISISAFSTSCRFRRWVYWASFSAGGLQTVSIRFSARFVPRLRW